MQSVTELLESKGVQPAALSELLPRRLVEYAACRKWVPENGESAFTSVRFISQKGVEHDRGGAGQKVIDHEIRPESRGTYRASALADPLRGTTSSESL